MSHSLLMIVILIAAFRFWTLYIASSNEKRMKMQGAIEYGHASTLALWVSTAAIYAGAAIEGFSFRHTQFDRLSAIGLAIYIFSALALLWVIRTLGPFWSARSSSLPATSSSYTPSSVH
jgi:isoprenylcysteine carboxyl methyltransferase (ICMT) family protein YpbQ